MPPLPKLPPSSLRPASLVDSGYLSTRSPEPRPYLVGAFRKTSTFDIRIVEDRTTVLFPHESEDARLTGSTRSLFRRLLALNLPLITTEGVAAKFPTPNKSFPKTA